MQCNALEFVKCEGERYWTEEVNCFYTNGASLVQFLFFTILLGICGIDRFCLGYPVIGFFKAISCGGFFVLYILDIILIATQTLQPADHSYFAISDASRIPRRENITNLPEVGYL